MFKVGINQLISCRAEKFYKVSLIIFEINLVPFTLNDFTDYGSVLEKG